MFQGLAMLIQMISLQQKKNQSHNGLLIKQKRIKVRHLGIIRDHKNIIFHPKLQKSHNMYLVLDHQLTNKNVERQLDPAIMIPCIKIQQFIWASNLDQVNNQWISLEKFQGQDIMKVKQNCTIKIYRDRRWGKMLGKDIFCAQLVTLIQDQEATKIFPLLTNNQHLNLVSVHR